MNASAADVWASQRAAAQQQQHQSLQHGAQAEAQQLQQAPAHTLANHWRPLAASYPNAAWATAQSSSGPSQATWTPPVTGGSCAWSADTGSIHPAWVCGSAQPASSMFQDQTFAAQSWINDQQGPVAPQPNNVYVFPAGRNDRSGQFGSNAGCALPALQTDGSMQYPGRSVPLYPWDQVGYTPMADSSSNNASAAPMDLWPPATANTTVPIRPTANWTSAAQWAQLPATQNATQFPAFPTHGTGAGAGDAVAAAATPKPAATSYADAVERARENCRMCDVARPDLPGLGCVLFSSGDPELFQRRQVRQTRPPIGQKDFVQGDDPIFVTPASSHFGDQHHTTPLFQTYEGQLFETPLDSTENKVCTGIMTNPHTGEMYETFENAMPPPTTTKYAIDKEQLQRTNPKLVWLNGGRDPNADLPTKTEVCEGMQLMNSGPNVWGEQVYAPAVRKLLTEYVSRDVFNNRNGFTPEEASMAREKPAGYTGYVPNYRPIPYLPPTNQLDIKDWVGPAFAPDINQANRDLVGSVVTTSKVDLTAIDRFGPACLVNDNPASGVVPVTLLRPTVRGHTATDYVGTAADADAWGSSGGHVILDTDPRATLKDLMELAPVPVWQAASPETQGASGQYVVLDTNPRASLKEPLMTQMFPTRGAFADAGGGPVVTSTEVRTSLKEPVMTQMFPTHGANASAGTGGSFTGYVVQDSTPRSTLKAGLMDVDSAQLSWPVFGVGGAADVQNAGFAVVPDTDLRPSLKQWAAETAPVAGLPQMGAFGAANTGDWVLPDADPRASLKEPLMSQMFPTRGAHAPGGGLASGGYVVTDTDPRASLKEPLMTQMFPTRGAGGANAGYGGYVVTDADVRVSLKEPLMSQTFPTHGAGGTAAGTGGYVVQDADPRASLKEPVMSQMFPTRGAGAGAGTGSETRGYVVLDTDPRASLKEPLMSQMFPVAAGNATNVVGGYVVQDTDLRASLKEPIMSQMFSAHGGAAGQDNIGNGGWVINDTSPRESAKMYTMNQAHPVLGAQAQDTGEYVVAPTEHDGTYRQYYATHVITLQAQDQSGGGGQYVGPGMVMSNQCRGTFPVNHVTLSRVIDAVGGGELAPQRIVSASERDQKRQFTSYLSMPDFVQANGVCVQGAVPWPINPTPSCRRPDDYTTDLTVRPDFFGRNALQM